MTSASSCCRPGAARRWPPLNGQPSKAFVVGPLDCQRTWTACRVATPLQRPVPGIQHHPHSAVSGSRTRQRATRPGRAGRGRARCGPVRSPPFPGTPNATSWWSSAQSRPTPSTTTSASLDDQGRWRHSAVVMDQSSYDDTREGVRPPPVTSEDAVSSRSSRDKRPKRSSEVPMTKERNAISDHATDPATEAFVAYRNLLFTVAYEMLGSAADAEDVLQETWLRWVKVDVGQVRDQRAYLVRITTRQAPDRVPTMRRRREAYIGPWLPEPLLTAPDVAEDVELAESVSVALMLVL